MVDAVAGGGGLISLPALIVFLPGVPIAAVMGTNKFASSFGPGTGSFLVFALAGIFGFDYVSASANGRLINVAATLSAMLYFLAQGLVHFDVAVPMAVCTILGGLVGSKLVLTHGAKFIRVAF